MNITGPASVPAGAHILVRLFLAVANGFTPGGMCPITQTR